MKVSCGYHHTLLLNNNGNVFSFGKGNMGQLGLGQYQNSFVPEMIDIKDVVDIACGWQHSVILNNEGYVYTFGCNEFN